MATKKLKISEREESFVIDVIEKGIDPAVAYKKHWSCSRMTDIRIRSNARVLMKKDTVMKRMEQMVFERKNVQNLDEKFVVDILKRTAIEKEGTTVGVRALELLGKAMGMFKEKQIIEDITGHRATSDRIFALAEEMEKGNDVSDQIDQLDRDHKSEVEIYDFTVIGSDDEQRATETA